MCVCVCVCVCHNKKKAVDEWQARQMISLPAILQVAASTMQEKKPTASGLSHLSIDAIHKEERKREREREKQFF